MTRLTLFIFWLAAGAGAGLLGGVVLGEVFEHHEEREREEAYDQGQLNLLPSHFLT